MGSNKAVKLPLSIIMAGGEGSRFGRSDKYMVQIGGVTMLDRIVQLARKLSDDVVICTKKSSESTVRYCNENSIKFIIEEENNYIDAQRYALCKLRSFPALMLSADLFVFRMDHLLDFVSFSLERKEDVVTLLQRGKTIGVSIFNTCREDMHELSSESFNVMADFCININTLRDYQIALEIYSSRLDSI